MDPIVEMITRARISLLLRQPFWGTLASRLLLKDATDDPTEWCKTAATDGRYLYYNRNFIKKLSKDELIFVVAHEVEHNVYDHMDRRGSRDPKVWNAAADYVINGELVEHRIGKMPDPVTSGITVCHDTKFKGMFAEEVYTHLINDPNFKYVEFDVHMEPGDGNGEPISDEERRQLRDSIRSAVMQAAKAAGADKVPAGIRRLLQEFTEPQMDWREILQLKLQSMIKTDFTWQRCSRKSQSSGIYLPAMKDDYRADAAVAIDCSGSMSGDMLRDLVSEVKGIMEQFSDFKLHLWCFDTSVYNHAVFTPENLGDIDTYEITGGGGTDFTCNWDFMEEQGLTPERFVMMTDGYPCGSWGNEQYCDTVFLIHGDTRRSITAPFGTTIHYEPPASK